MKITARHLSDLERKYRTLATLRRAREEAQARGLDAFPPDERLPRRTAMRALAREFPGALRELDETPAAELEARARALAAGRDEPWMEAAVLFHTALREALALRRGDADPLEFWTDSRLGDDARRQLERPESGRLLDVVWSAVAQLLAVTPGEAERRVYPQAPARGVRQRE